MKIITRATHVMFVLGALTSAAAAGGNVCSHKTGRCASVAPRYSAVFQAYVNDIEAWSPETKVWYMGGLRKGHCTNASQHPCGSALDVCQDARGIVSRARNCHLPPPHELAAIASRHNLFEGSRWCSSDYGHAQVHMSAGDCGNTLMASFKRHRKHMAVHVMVTEPMAEPTSLR